MQDSDAAESGSGEPPSSLPPQAGGGKILLGMPRQQRDVTANLVQFLVAGLTIGAVYALVALGFSIIYNATEIINFAQGEFVMIGGMASVFLVGTGVPLIAAILVATLVAALVGVALERIAIRPARGATTVSLIIITIGASIFLRGLAQLVWGKGFHRLPSFSGDEPILVMGAALQKQSLWAIAVAALIVVVLTWFFGRTLFGRSVLATAFNPLAARLVGVDVGRVMLFSFALAAALGAVAGALVAPITLTYYNVGIMLGLKGFAASILGGLGSFPGAVAGGLVLGLVEALATGYVSSAYKDAVAFVVILAVLFVAPAGLFGRRAVDRV